MSEQMKFITSRQTVRKLLAVVGDITVGKLTSGQHRANVKNGGSHDKSANGQKTDVGPTLFFWPNYDIGKLTSGRHLTNVGKDEIHDQSANDQKIDVGPTLLFRPDYDIAKLTSGRHLANVGTDEIHDKSANDQNIDVGPTLFRPDYDRCRKTDVGPTSDKRWPS